MNVRVKLNPHKAGLSESNLKYSEALKAEGGETKNMISIKKLATVGAAAGLLFGSAMPAFAGHWRSSDDLIINQTNNADIQNRVFANSNTGNQSIGGGGGGSLSLNEDGDGDHGRRSRGNFALRTGDAETGVLVENIANSNDVEVSGCGCFDDVTITQTNGATINNGVFANSNSGNQTLGRGSNKAIRTGNALTGVAVANLVNSNVAVVN